MPEARQGRRFCEAASQPKYFEVSLVQRLFGFASHVGGAGSKEVAASN